MRNFIAFLIGVTLAFLICIPFAHADSGAWLRPNTKFNNGLAQQFSDKASACQSRGGTLGADSLQGTYDGLPLYKTACMSGGSVLVHIIYYSQTGDACPAGVAQHAYTCLGTCPEGTASVNGLCVIPPCYGKGGDEAQPPAWYESAPAVACVSGCAAKRYTYIDQYDYVTRIVNGKKSYYFQFAYNYADDGSGNGFACSDISSDMPDAPAGSSSPPTESCGAGQTMGQLNNETVCVDSSSGEPQETAKETTSTTTTTNPDGSTTTTKTTVHADGSKTVEKTTTPAPGSTDPVTTSKENYTTDGTPVTPIIKGGNGVTGGDAVPGGTGSGSGSGSGIGGGTDPAAVGEGVDAGIESYCATNPTSPICKETSSGEAAATTDLYQSKADGKTFEGVFDNFNDRIQAAPAITAATQFFDVSNLPAGSCAGLDTSFTVFGATFEVNLTEVFCSSFATDLYSYLNLGVQLVATWLAFTIAFL